MLKKHITYDLLESKDLNISKESAGGNYSELNRIFSYIYGKQLVVLYVLETDESLLIFTKPFPKNIKCLHIKFLFTIIICIFSSTR